ncbi:MAG TPA: TIGR03790 family protein [Gemmataceae bacterium]|nr:TIGR03790 family protein [Gemmataceae bacterium]
MRRTIAFLLAAGPAFALDPAEVVVLVNKNVAASTQVANHYVKARGVPPGNVVALDLPKDEDISRKDYDEKLVAPLRTALKDRKGEVKCLLCVYGVPLRVGGSVPSDAEREDLRKLEPQIKEAGDAIKKAEADLKALGEKKEDPPGTSELLRKDKQKELESLRRKQELLVRRRGVLSHAESQAAVDSELMLLWWESYELRRWQLNLNYFQVPAKDREGKPPVLLTARLDGPSPDLVIRLIDDAIATEKEGLQGKVYVDARGIRFDPKGPDRGHGYGGYDESMREMAALLKGPGGMDVVLDDRPELFPPGSCPDCALYCGWYSHGNFIDCCKFVRGAVAWHLASSEAVSLRRPDVKFWCKNLLDKGACATIGPVAEPYTVGFPKPAEFFGFLATGKYTLAECYGKSVLFASWMCTLVGDPLYNPFRASPRIKVGDVQPSPKGGRIPPGGG